MKKLNINIEDVKYVKYKRQNQISSNQLNSKSNSKIEKLYDVDNFDDKEKLTLCNSIKKEEVVLKYPIIFDNRNKNFLIRNNLVIKEKFALQKTRKNKNKNLNDNYKFYNLFINEMSDMNDYFNKYVFRKVYNKNTLENTYKKNNSAIMINPIEIDALIRLIYQTQKENIPNFYANVKREMPDKLKKFIFKEINTNQNFINLIEQIFREVEIRNSKNKLVSKEYIANLLNSELERAYLQGIPPFYYNNNNKNSNNNNNNNSLTLPEIDENKLKNRKSLPEIIEKNFLIKNTFSPKLNLNNPLEPVEEDSELSQNPKTNGDTTNQKLEIKIGYIKKFKKNRTNDLKIKLEEIKLLEEKLKRFNVLDGISVIGNSLVDLSAVKKKLKEEINNFEKMKNYNEKLMSKIKRSSIKNKETSTIYLNSELDNHNEIEENKEDHQSKSNTSQYFVKHKHLFGNDNEELLDNKRHTKIKSQELVRNKNISGNNTKEMLNINKHSKTKSQELVNMNCHSKNSIEDISNQTSEEDILNINRKEQRDNKNAQIKNKENFKKIIKTKIEDKSEEENINKNDNQPIRNSEKPSEFNSEEEEYEEESVILSKTLITQSSQGFSVKTFDDEELRKTIDNILEKIQRSGTNFNKTSNYFQENENELFDIDQHERNKRRRNSKAFHKIQKENNKQLTRIEDNETEISNVYNNSTLKISLDKSRESNISDSSSKKKDKDSHKQKGKSKKKENYNPINLKRLNERDNEAEENYIENKDKKRKNRKLNTDQIPEKSKDKKEISRKESIKVNKNRKDLMNASTKDIKDPRKNNKDLIDVVSRKKEKNISLIHNNVDEIHKGKNKRGKYKDDKDEVSYDINEFRRLEALRISRMNKEAAKEKEIKESKENINNNKTEETKEEIKTEEKKETTESNEVTLKSDEEKENSQEVDINKFKIEFNFFKIKTVEKESDKNSKKSNDKKQIKKKVILEKKIPVFEEPEKEKDEEIENELEAIIKYNQVDIIKKSIDLDSLVKFKIISKKNKEEIKRYFESGAKDRKGLRELLQLIKLQNEIKKKHEEKTRKKFFKKHGNNPAVKVKKTEEELKQELELREKANLLNIKIDSYGVANDALAEQLLIKRKVTNIFDVDSFLTQFAGIQNINNSNFKEFNADDIVKNISNITHKNMRAEELEIANQVLHEERLNLFVEHFENSRLHSKIIKRELASQLKLLDISTHMKMSPLLNKNIEL